VARGRGEVLTTADGGTVSGKLRGKKTVPDADGARVLDEVVAVALLTAAIFALVSLFTYERAAPSANLGGPVGYGLADAVVQALGLASYLVPALALWVGVALFRQRSELLSVARAGGACWLVLSMAVVTAIVRANSDVGTAGGWIGGFIATLLGETLGKAGALLLALSLLIVSLVFTTATSLRVAFATVAQAADRGRSWAAGKWVRDLERRHEAVLPPRPNLPREATPPRAQPVIVLRDVIEPEPPPALLPATRSAPKTEGEKPARPAVPVVQEVFPFSTDGRYQLPSTSFLDLPQRGSVKVDEEALRKSSQILETKLADFGIQGKVTAVRPGPVITTFEIEPAPGVKVNRIVTLADDLAMALRAIGVRILAPVPGTAVVGIEVANARREHISLKEIVESDPFAASGSPLTIALGKDTAGSPVVADLARMPHLMVAGATGTGKSVSLNAMIMSILYKASPRDVRFIMIDLKMLELSVYEDIPHLLVPVVTDPKKAVAVLKNIVEQMDERYQLMKGLGVRNIEGYNRIVDREEQERKAGIIELSEVVDEEIEQPAEQGPPLREHLPKIIIIIDELADLMMTVGRNVEEPITRLAQKARAAGIHLIVATQRPSVDVITGLIKANFPARVSFQVTARVDSRTILDHIGAERLLGGGDMLYLPPGTARVQRLHGPFVSETEIHKVVNFIKRQGSPHYVFDLLKGDEEDQEDAVGDDELEDALYDQAVRLVTESRQASISWVQRRLRVGYNRAARMIERMEREGVITSSEGGRPREVIARRIDGD
jgi:S-DNA-T family DNA segregation ATPase FtsK/SpoIIIE